jgi:Fe-S cluster assembly ATP-binding protein
MNSLKIDKLCVEVDNKLILDNFCLEIKSGEIHAIMGPNGTGKSTLAKVIMGDPIYKVISGKILYNGKSINNMPTDERARLGIFLGMQLPLEVEGVTNADFLRTACSIKEGNNFSLMPFIKEMDNTIKKLHMDKSMIHRGINQGFSGGERKKNEILQMYMLKPNTVLLDEIDSGLDVDSLKIVGENVMDYYNENKPGMLVITHYQRLLDYIIPTHVHIMKSGRIVKSGGASLVKLIEEVGYEKITDESSTCIVSEK